MKNQFKVIVPAVIGFMATFIAYGYGGWFYFGIVGAISILVVFLFLVDWHQKKYLRFSKKWRKTLNKKVLFYHHLDASGKKDFERKVLFFLNTTKITGVKTDVSDEDRLLVASSAVIPVFAFEGWTYNFLNEVILYPEAFDKNFEFDAKSEFITGMVGTGGAMDNVMVLSKPALHQGFENLSGKQNVGIHEFIHLIDKADGSIDGGLDALAGKNFSVPWVSLMQKEVKKMLNEDSDIDIYGATNSQEFLAVAGEYFFERPDLFQKKHPELYQMLSEAFEQNPAQWYRPKKKKNKKDVGRNDLCPCGSGKKYKKCCLRKDAKESEPALD